MATSREVKSDVGRFGWPSRGVSGNTHLGTLCLLLPTARGAVVGRRLVYAVVVVNLVLALLYCRDLMPPILAGLLYWGSGAALVVTIRRAAALCRTSVERARVDAPGQGGVRDKS